MPKLHFCYSTMNAGKSTALLQTAYNYEERGMSVAVYTAKLDHRAGEGVIASRAGLRRIADTFAPDTDLLEAVARKRDVACVLIDEAQFLSEPQVWQLARVVDDLGIPVMCFGLRTDFQGRFFPGSQALMAVADELREVRTICHCGAKATMVVRRDDQGRAVLDGEQVVIGGNDTYESLCRRHWSEARALARLDAPLDLKMVAHDSI